MEIVNTKYLNFMGLEFNLILIGLPTNNNTLILESCIFLFLFVYILKSKHCF